jgi:hypothetical protein
VQIAAPRHARSRPEQGGALVVGTVARRHTIGTRFRARSATPIVLPLAGVVNGFNSGLCTAHPLASQELTARPGSRSTHVPGPLRPIGQIRCPLSRVKRRIDNRAPARHSGRSPVRWRGVRGAPERNDLHGRNRTVQDRERSRLAGGAPRQWWVERRAARGA